MTETAVSRVGAYPTDEEAIAFLRREGFSKVECIKALVQHRGHSLREAKVIVHTSDTWSDVRDQDDQFHQDLLDAATKLDLPAGRIVEMTLRRPTEGRASLELVLESESRGSRAVSTITFDDVIDLKIGNLNIVSYTAFVVRDVRESQLEDIWYEVSDVEAGSIAFACSGWRTSSGTN